MLFRSSSFGHHIRTLELGTQPANSYLVKDRAAYWDGRSHIGDTTWKLMFFQTKSDTLNTSNPNLLPFGNVECGLRNRNQVDLTINTNRHVEIISPLEGWRFTNTT